MKIAFWSPLHGTGTTSSLMATAVAMSVRFPKRIIVTQTHYNMNNLEGPLLGSVGKGDFFRDMGVDAIMRHFKSGNITEEHILNCSIKMSETLYLLAGTKMLNRDGFESNVARSMLLHIFSVMEKYFDIVMIDTNSGQNEFSMKVIEECDVVVVSLRQNKAVLDGFFESGLFEGKRVFYLFSDYDKASKYSVYNIKHLYRAINHQNCAFLPHCYAYLDAISEEKVVKYIVNKLDMHTELEEESFFCALRKFVDTFGNYLTGMENE